MKRTIEVIITTVGMLALGPSTAEAVAVSCGDTIGPNAGKVVVDNDLTCSTGSTPAITVEGPGTKVDFQYHRIDGNSHATDVCIQIHGEKAAVSNAVAVDCADAGVAVGGSGNHSVESVYAESNDATGVQVDSNENKIANSVAMANSTNGFAVLGSHNQVKDCTSTDNATSGVGAGFTSQGVDNKFLSNLSSGNDVGFATSLGDGNGFVKNVAISNDDAGWFEFGSSGDGKKFSKNQAIANGAEGFLITSSDNQMTGNRAIANGAEGILLDSGTAGNRVQKNESFANGTDLADSACTSNSWGKNSFSTSSGACVQ